MQFKWYNVCVFTSILRLDEQNQYSFINFPIHP